MAATPPPTRLCRRGLEKAQTASAARNGKSFRAPTVSRLDRHGSAPTLALTVRACPPCWPDPRRTGTAPCPTPATLACVYRCLRACVLARARARGAAGTKRITGRRASGRPAWPWPVGAPTRARSSATRRQGPGQRVFSHPNGSSASTFPTHTHAPPPLRTHIAPTSSTPCCPSKGHTCTLALARARRAKVTAAPHVLLPSGPTSSGDLPPLHRKQGVDAPTASLPLLDPPRWMGGRADGAIRSRHTMQSRRTMRRLQAPPTVNSPRRE